MKRLTAILLLLCIFLYLPAQNNTTMNSGAILQALKKLNTIGSVLYVAAHPDDENTRLLGYLANERKFRTAYLSITRGDGGQNLIGKEQSEMLGLIRTQELLAARSTDGAEQYFTRANDFGYSKTPEETMSFWNKDSVLSDVVLVIRKLKPDVIICRFPTTGEGGHGHHTASAILALEAFDAAADPAKFPEQLKYVDVWQAKRIFWNTFNFGGTNTTAADQLKVDVGLFNPLLGKGYGEIAAESRSMHKSQGFGSARQRGESIEYFKLLKGDNALSDPFEAIGSTWNRLGGTEAVQTAIDACIKKYDPSNPENSVGSLIAVHKAISALSETDKQLAYWKKQKLKETESLLLACSGIWLEAMAADPVAIPGKEISITAQAIFRNNVTVRLNKVTYLQSDTITSLEEMDRNVLYTFKRKEKLPASFSFSNPYWLNSKHETGMYTVSDPLLIGKPENDPQARVIFDLHISDLHLKIERPLVHKSTDPVKGEIYRPLEILPPATINFPEKSFVFKPSETKKIRLTLKANVAKAQGQIQVKATEGWKVVPITQDFSLTNKNDETIIEVEVTADNTALSGKIHAFTIIDSMTYSKSIQRVEYDHIPYQFILSEARSTLFNVDLKTKGNKIGYIPGAGDDVPAALKQIGYQVTMLNDDLLSTEDLSKYNAIVTGVRAYNTEERLQVHYNKLMDYVKKGGNLVVQYNTNNRIGPVVAKIGPYPFTISRDRVTDEKAEVKLLNEKHPALNFPNKISSKDFDGWIQERGIYFATELDKQYETVLQMNDPNEKASDGSLIIAKHGKGNFVYTGLAFFRELPAGVPGAYKLFVNLLSLPQNN